LIKIRRTRAELFKLYMDLLGTHGVLTGAPNDNVTQLIYFKGQYIDQLSKLGSLLPLHRTSSRHTVLLKHVEIGDKKDSYLTRL
jgi:hypothetical protein